MKTTTRKPRSLAAVRYTTLERRIQAVERLEEKVAENDGEKREFWQEMLDEAVERLEGTLGYRVASV